MANPQSRNEEILQSIVDDTEYTKVPQSREEFLLLEIKDIIEHGGGGTSDVQGLVLTMNTTTYVVTAYLIDGEGQRVGDTQTIDIPLEATIVDASYNNTTKTITFTLTSGAYLTVPIGDIIYGLQPLIDSNHKLSSSLVDDSLSKLKFTWSGTTAQYAIDGPSLPEGTPVLITDDTDIDSVPTQGSSNPVTSDGVYTGLSGKADISDFVPITKSAFDNLVSKTAKFYFVYPDPVSGLQSFSPNLSLSPEPENLSEEVLTDDSDER